jgi:hypothetical protein
MRCYNHSEVEAVGTCKACNRGLCPECVVDLGPGLSCRGAHEQRVADIELLISRNLQVQRVAGGSKYLVPAFTLFMGAVFTGYGLFYDRKSDFIVVIGVGLLVYGAYLVVVNRRAFGKGPG